MERYELPDGWEWVTVQELAENIQYGYTERANDEPIGPKFLRITDIQNGKVDWSTVPYCKCSDNDLERFRLASGDIVFARTGATTGKSFLIADPPKAVFASYLIRLRLRESVNRKYFAYFLDSPNYWSQIMQVRKGSAQPGVNASILAEVNVPLAPLPIQEDIVTKIEGLLGQSRTARTALTRVPVLMAQFRRAVLASAFRGELVEPDPNDEPTTSLLERIHEAREQSGHKKVVESIDTLDLPELPKGWEWVAIEQIGDVSGGLTKNSKRSALPKKLSYLRVANVYSNELDLSDVQEIGIQESELVRVKLEKGDLLVVEGNGSIEQIGRAAVWDGSIEPCVHQNHIIKVRFAPTEISRYVLFWLLSTEGRDQIMNVTSSTSGLYTLSLSKVSQLLVPLAPLALQSRIVAKIEAMFAQADIIEQAASVSLRRAEQVDQSILARAFRGELG